MALLFYPSFRNRCTLLPSTVYRCKLNNYGIFLRIYLLKIFSGKRRKRHFWAPKFEKFSGEHAPTTPSLQYLRKSKCSFCACTFKTLTTPLGIVLWYYHRAWVRCGFTSTKKAPTIAHLKAYITFWIETSALAFLMVSPVHFSDNKSNFNVLTFIINAKLSLTLCFCLYSRWSVAGAFPPATS